MKIWKDWQSGKLNVEDVAAFYECIRSIIKHFQCSVKDKEILDTCLEILELGKMHLVLLWYKECPFFWMHAMFLRTWLLLCMMQCLPSPYWRRIVLHFFHMKIFLYSSSWLMFRKVFENGYLQKVDKSNTLVTCVYGIAHTASVISSLKTPKADAFLDSLEFNGNGNLLSKMTNNGNSHSVLLRTNATSPFEEKVKKCWLC